MQIRNSGRFDGWLYGLCAIVGVLIVPLGMMFFMLLGMVLQW